jgi:hypothetical protein
VGALGSTLIQPERLLIQRTFNMNQKETLIKEINGLPDFMVGRLLEMIRYIKLGIEFEFLAKVDNAFYQSDEFKNIVAESISEYRQGKTDDMDLSK